MLLQAASLVATVVVGDAEAPAVRQERPVAAWIAPELTFDSLGTGVLPIGLQVAWQVHGPFALTFGAVWLPAANVERRQATLGARWYLAGGELAPYLSADVGAARQGIDDTGGQVRQHRFAAAGLGVELATRSGFSLTSDLELGPDHVTDYSTDAWRLTAWWRLGLGYRF
jgi:hypothetical protein